MKVIEITEDSFSNVMCCAHKLSKCSEELVTALKNVFTKDDEDNDYLPVEGNHSYRTSRHNYRYGGEIEYNDDDKSRYHEVEEEPRHRTRRSRYSY